MYWMFVNDQAAFNVQNNNLTQNGFDIECAVCSNAVQSDVQWSATIMIMNVHETQCNYKLQAIRKSCAWAGQLWVRVCVDACRLCSVDVDCSGFEWKIDCCRLAINTNNWNLLVEYTYIKSFRTLHFVLRPSTPNGSQCHWWWLHLIQFCIVYVLYAFEMRKSLT